MDFNGRDRQAVDVWVAFLSYLHYQGSLLVSSESVKDGLPTRQYVVDELCELVVIYLINLDLSTFQLLDQVPVQK